MDTVDLFRFKTTEQMETMMHDDHKRDEMSGELADIFFFSPQICTNEWF